MKNKHLLIPIAIMVLGMAVACEQQGPAERAGEKIDEAAEQGKENIQDAVEKAGEQLEEAGDTIRDKTQ